MKFPRRVHGDPSVPEQRLESGEIEQWRGIPRNEGPGRVNPAWAKPRGALADREASGIAGPERGQMTGHAGNIAIPAQNLVEGDGRARGCRR